MKHIIQDFDTDKHNLSWDRAVAATGEDITPLIWNPSSKSLLKFCSVPDYCVAHILKIKKHIAVLASPVKTSVGFFRCEIKPNFENTAQSIAGVESRLTKNYLIDPPS